MTIPSGFYAMSGSMFAGPVPPEHPCFVRTRFVMPAEQAARELAGQRRQSWDWAREEYPRLLLIGGPVAYGANKNAQDIVSAYTMRTFANPERVQLGPAYVATYFWLDVPLEPVPIWKPGSAVVGMGPLTWPRSDFQWQWVWQSSRLVRYKGAPYWDGRQTVTELALDWGATGA